MNKAIANNQDWLRKIEIIKLTLWVLLHFNWIQFVCNWHKPAPQFYFLSGNQQNFPPVRLILIISRRIVLFFLGGDFCSFFPSERTSEQSLWFSLDFWVLFLFLPVVLSLLPIWTMKCWIETKLKWTCYASKFSHILTGLIVGAHINKCMQS